nr:phage tail protein [Zoogloeaceae bacterium]
MSGGTKGVAELKQLARWVKNLPTQVRKAAVSSVNTTVVQLRDEAETALLGKLNLPPAYIRGKLRAVRATQGKPVGRVAITRSAMPLGRFGARQNTTPAKRAKGDRLRRIPAGHKQAGVSLQVGRGGSRKNLGGAFLVPLKNAGGMGVFLRSGPARKDIEHLYGPSPSQVFRIWRDDNRQRVGDVLEMNFDAALRRALKTDR